MPKLHVFLDTSILPRIPGKFGNTFQGLIDLVSEEVIQVYISDVALNEWKTQFEAEILNLLKETDSSIIKSLRNNWLKELDTGRELADVHEKIPSYIEDAGKLVEQKVLEVLAQLKAEILPVLDSHGKMVVNDYFKGSNAFKSQKNRSDFPDSFIFHSLIDLKNALDSELCFIVADKHLSQIATKLPGVNSYPSISSFFDSDELRRATDHIGIYNLWDLNFSQVAKFFQEHDEDLRDLLESSSIETLSFHAVSHPSIPEDNNIAEISAINAPQIVGLDWEQVKSLGPGVFAVPFSLKALVEIIFDVYKKDAYSVPKGVEVNILDPEEHEYFNATGAVNVLVKGVASVGVPNFNSMDIQENLDEILIEMWDLGDEVDLNVFEPTYVSIEKIENVEIIDKGFGEIFL